MINLILGDCLDQLKKMKDNSVDSVVTDPPYGLAFMGKKWDYDVPSVEIWKEVLRVLKPGGHLLSFGGTRTYHRMVINIEDAGFEIRDQIMWIYGSGFPKSMDISKAIDKQAGVERKIVGKSNRHASGKNGKQFADGNFKPAEDCLITAPATDSAKQWQGWGTALKPANEPICLARKPISEKTVASNVLKHGTGAMNIDESRIGENPGYSYPNGAGGNSFSVGNGVDGTRKEPVVSTQGRWPANVIFDEEAGKILDEQTGERKSAGKYPAKNPENCKSGYGGGFDTQGPLYDDRGGASRFFYCAKTSKSERGTENTHPTVKPIKLMTYLIKLITPPGGIVLDPFMGSGSTGRAAIEGSFSFIGIEREEAYFEIAKSRINKASNA